MKGVLSVALLAGALLLPAHALADSVEVKIDGSVVAKAELKTATDDNRVLTGTSARSLAAASGCRTVDVARVGRDIFGFVVYKFHQRKRWCWDYPEITSRYVSTYVTDVDPNMEYRGVVGANGYFYTWCCSNGRSGHYSFRQGKFENCVLWFPCMRTEYPWVRIRSRGDGSYAYRTGL